MATFTASHDKNAPPIPAAEPAPSPPPAAAEEAPQDDSIGADQLASTVVITGLPVLERAATLSGLSEAYASVSCGDAVQTILQQDGEQQHAVVIMSSAAAAQAACALNGTPILGNPVGVVLAMVLQQGGEAPAPAPTPAPAPESAGEGKADPASTRTSSLFARAKSGIATAAASVAITATRVDQTHGISKNVNVAALAAKAKAMQIDQRYGISQGVSKAVGEVNAGIKAADERYKITERTQAASAAATKKAEELAQKALKNEKVRKGWNFTKGLAARASRAVSGAVDSVAREATDVREMTQAEYARRASAEGLVAAAQTAQAAGAEEPQGPQKDL